MKIKDILQVKGSKVWMIKENQTLHEALHVLIEQKIGALLVLKEKGQEISGIISERDIVRGCYFNRRKWDSVLVKDLMTRQIFIASPQDDIQQVMSTMTEKRVRHIPVLSEGELQGIVSIGDIVKFLLQDSEHQIQHLKQYLYGANL